MKRLALVLGVLLAASVLIFTGCQGKTAAANEASATQAAAPAEKVKVGIVVRVLTGNSFQIELARISKEVAERLGCEANVYAPQSFTDYAEQTNIVESLITKKVDLIIIAPNHQTAINPVLDKAKAAGIPVVLYDTKAQHTDVPVAYVGPDNEAAAYEAVKYLCEKMGGKGKLVHLEGESGFPAAGWRKDGMLRAIKEYPDIKLVVSQNAHWTSEGGMQVMENALQAHPDVAGVFAANDDAAFGAIEACKSKGVNPVIVGFDAIPQALEMVKKGEMAATVNFSPETMAEYAVRVGLAYIKNIRGGKNEPKVFKEWIDSGATVVDISNVDEFIAK